MHEKQAPPNLSRDIRLAIYDMPKIVGQRLSEGLSKSGCEVLFEGKLDERTASHEADIWLTKWSYGLSGDFLKEHHPRLGIITATVGTDHIDKEAIGKLNLRLESCPKSSSNSVAEHAIMLAMRGICEPSKLPPLCEGRLIFSGYSDFYAESAIANMLMRSRQIDLSVERARNFNYLDRENRRPSAPWENKELAGMSVGILGKQRDSSALVRMLRKGFQCDIRGFDTPGWFDLYGVMPDAPRSIIDGSDYVFICDDRYTPMDRPHIPSSMLNAPEVRFQGSNIAVLGTGNIGSILARIARTGFGCEVSAFSRTHKTDLMDIGVRYSETIDEAISQSNFIFISLPLTEKTRFILNADHICSLSVSGTKVLVNVTRDKIIESESLYDFISRGVFLSYGTDVLPNDAILCAGGKPDDLTSKFVHHRQIIATPHEADCSQGTLQRLLDEVLQKIDAFRI